MELKTFSSDDGPLKRINVIFLCYVVISKKFKELISLSSIFSHQKNGSDNFDHVIEEV